MKISIVYDGECPVCASIMQTLELRNRADLFELIDARTQRPRLNDVQGQDLSKLDLDEGFAIVNDEQIYLGSDAALMLSSIGSPSTLRFRIFRWLTKTPRRSRFFYPIMRSGRNLLLRILRRKKIQG